MEKALCIYHKNCVDGFGAAWAVRDAFGEEAVEFVGAGFAKGENVPPNVTGRDVIIVDYAGYSRETILQMAITAKTITILDHHKTNVEALQGIMNEHPHIDAELDTERSGAMITWDYFHKSGERRPVLIDHIQDRDLWRFALPKTREINAWVFSYPYDFGVWDTLMAKDNDYLQHVAAVQGDAIDRKHKKDVSELLANAVRTMTIAGYRVNVANMPYTMGSDAANILAVGEPFAACYMDTETGRYFMLRSSKQGLDVEAIAKQYGGGGHKHAAGFTLERATAASSNLLS